MLYLFTGLMGASKTLNALKFVKEDDAFKDRPVYYHRIKILDHDFFAGWKELNDDALKEWQSLPTGSVIIVDEADHVFPQRPGKIEMPDYIRKLKESRSLGMDFVFLTQHPSLVDVFVRRNIGTHHHLERMFGAERSKWFTWSKYTDHENQTERNRAITSQVSFDKKYYGKYKSAEKHTHKKRIPWKMLLMPFLLAFSGLAFAGYKFMNWFDEEPVPTIQEQVSHTMPGDSPILYSEPRTSPAETDYFEQRKPRVENIPWSAPIYDEIHEVKSFPRPQCFLWNSGAKMGQCRCVTQQATPMNVDYETCVNIVQNGDFQDFVPDRALLALDDDSERQEPEAPAMASSKPVTADIRHMSHSPRRRTQATPPRSYTQGAATK